MWEREVLVSACACRGGEGGGECGVWRGRAHARTCRTRATSTRPEYSSWRAMKSTSHSPAASFWLGLRPV
eukprot:6894045-Prymnesium_polylepis.1